MEPIFELSENIKNSMVSRVETQTQDAQIIKEAKKVSRKEGLITQFEPKDEFAGITYGMIDGASIKERTQGMDLTCIAVAGMSDGYFHYNLEDDDRPFAYWSTVKKYDKSYESQTQTIMMMCEVAILGKLKGYNYRGMDGAYSTSLVNLLISINNHEYDLLLDFLCGENGSDVFNGLDQLLSPPTDENSQILGIAKSDVSDHFVDSFKAVGNTITNMLPTDRALASALLEPGDMFTPMNKKLGSFLNKGINKTIEDLNLSNDHKDCLLVIHDKLIKNDLDNRVYSTYFCPSDNALPGKVMRVDFSLPAPYTMLKDKEIRFYAEQAVQIINNDVVSMNISEPYAQYKVDEFCKKTIRESLKQAKIEAREIFDEKDPTGTLGNNILESYRT